GVITVLTKLFHLVQPTRAYFGLKDAQQFSVVHSLIKQLNFPIELIGLPTVRELDGLARSSRNVYLTERERKEAVQLYKGLLLGQKLIQNGETNLKKVSERLATFIKDTTVGKIDYIEDR